MKLAERIIGEVLSSRLSIVNKPVKTDTEMDSYYTISESRGTKVVIPTKDGKYRPIVITSNVNLGSYSTLVFNEDKNISIQYFLDGYLEESMVNKWKSFYVPYGYPDNTVSTKGKPKITIKKDHGWMSKEKFYLWLIGESVLDIVIKTHFPNMAEIEVADSKIKHGDIEFIGFDQKKHKELLDLIDDADSKLKKAGFGNLMYGKIYLVPKANNKKTFVTFADYLKDDDSVRIFDASQSSAMAQPIKTIIHELGHRHYYKKLNTGALDKIRQRFILELSNFNKDQNDKDIKIKADHDGFKIGDILNSKKHGELQFGGVGPRTLNGRKIFYKFYQMKNGQKTSAYLSFEKLVDAIKYFGNQDKVEVSSKNAKVDNMWLPTPYSRTSQIEWFAEVFAFAVMGNNKEILNWIKEL